MKQQHVIGEDNGRYNKIFSKEFEDEANKLIEQQNLLHRELTELNDFSFLQ